MARWKTLNETKDVLGRRVSLNRVQWSLLILVLAVPLLAIVGNIFGLNYEAQANQSEISTNDQLIDQLTQQNQQLIGTVEEQTATINQQKKQINSLKSDNQDLSSSLSATEAELAEQEDKKDKHDKKKHDCDDGWWWCDND